MKFSKSTIKASFLVQHPDFYTYRIDKIRKSPSADKKSTNYFLDLIGLDGEMEGVPVSKLINEKADWLLYPLFKAANGGVDLTEDQDVEVPDLAGFVLRGMTVRGQRQDGTPMNDITDWAPTPENDKTAQKKE